MTESPDKNDSSQQNSSSEASMNSPKRGRGWLWGVLLLAAISGGFYAYKTETLNAPRHEARQQERNGAAPLAPVQTATAQKGRIEVFLDALGTVTSSASITIKPQISGQLMDLGFQEGQTVQKGDFLAQIDPRPYENALHQAEGVFVKDSALLADAQRILDRNNKLATSGAVSKQERDTQEALVHQLEGTVKADQAQLDTAKLNLSYCRITAPVSGRVGLRQVDVGNYVQLSDANGLVTITQLQPISVIFSIPEDKVPDLMKGGKEGESFPVEAYDRTQTTKLASGKLSSIDNQIDTSTGTIKLRALFENEEGLLFPNQFVNVRLLLKVLDDALVVPTSAIQRGAAGTFVYLVKNDGTVSIQPIKLGPAQGEKTAIADGLNEGDVVVTDGTDKLTEGAKVQIAGSHQDK